MNNSVLETPLATISTLLLDASPLLTADVERVARFGAKVEISRQTCDRLAESRSRMLSAISDGQPHYGLNTGFGALANVRIDESALKSLQVNLIRSHSTGVGKPLAVEIVRATMLLLAASLCRGLSGVRPALVELLVEMLNKGITPIVPETGSVGASGDLAPLAHIALVLIGEGEAGVGDEVMPGKRALAMNKLQPLELEAKEGLAMINGTHLMAGTAAMLVESFLRLFDAALVAAAMSVDTCRATSAVLDPRIHSARCQLGQIVVSEKLRGLLAGSQIVESHREDDVRVQDPYSFRCCPAVLGAAWDAFEYVREKVNAELGAVTDNPLVFPSENDRKGQSNGTEQSGVDIVSGGNFHGLPLALPLDVFAIAVSHLAGISERRIFHMLSGHDPEAELPTFLTPQAGLQSGLMIAQYAAAACCNELIGLANPASVANLSTSAGMEDYNSFGPRSAAKAQRAVELARSVVSIELLCASTGLDHHRPLRSGEKIENAFESIRARIPALVADRPPAPDIRVLEEMIDAGEFSAIGP